jgi:hypothetical protein
VGEVAEAARRLRRVVSARGGDSCASGVLTCGVRPQALRLRRRRRLRLRLRLRRRLRLRLRLRSRIIRVRFRSRVVRVA